MNRSTRGRRLRAAVLTALLAGAASSLGADPAEASAGHTLIQGSGSSWAANAVNQWIADVHSNGLQVVYTASGSASGRKDYANNTVDFAVSDIGFQGTDPATGQDDTSQGRSYAYLPIVAGGTALPYQINVGGQMVRNLRLSGETIAKIFTNRITNWDDPAITADNNGHALPSLPIIPVVHSEGSGSTYQFTRWMATEYPSIWKPYSGLGATEYFPPPQGSQIAENGSDGVMNFVSSGAGNGSIGYDEYSYALGKNYPVAKVLNKAGYYTLPNQYNVAVALTQAQINLDKSSPDYLLQNLDDVYAYNDKRVYPISSYSYAIIPTAADDSKMTSAKRQTITDYLDFSVCQGQSQMGPIGYSPLPINLVQASFDQIAKLHDADPAVDTTNATVRSCNNPTFDPSNPQKNYLAEIAPFPPSCDQQGAGPCTGLGDTGQTNPPPAHYGGGTGSGNGNQGGGTTSGGNGGKHGGGHTSRGGHGGANGNQSGGNSNTGTGGSTPGGDGSNTGGTIQQGGVTAGAAPTGSSTGGTTGGTHIDPVTGQTVPDSGVPAASTTGQAVAAPLVLPAANSHQTDVTLAVIAGVLLLLLLVVPPFVASSLRHRSPRRPGDGR